MIAIRDEARVPRGFTIIELLIVIVLLGLLATILSSVIGAVRDQAADLRSLANLRSHGQILAVYQIDWRDAFPQFADPQADYSVVRDRRVAVTFEYFAGVVYWPIALSEQYYDGNVIGNDVFLHPRSEFEDFNVYNFSSSLMAQPTYWNRKTREFGNRQWGGSRVDQVTFPSSKAQLVEWHPLYPLPIATENFTRLQPNSALSLVDGSATRVHTSELVPPYPFGDGTGPGTYQSIGVFGMHTPDGWRGRDVK